ncbi:MAG: RNase adapter RapZ [Acidobacteria bacterium]|nr:RNase adapter RapZ [Acidobacteriota bacterium]
MTDVVIITGLSGSGKTLALRSLEDMGYFAVDNLPIPLIRSFVELLDRAEGTMSLGALVVDVRERSNLEILPEVIADLRARPTVRLTILFLSAQEETLVRRFSETRRPHPLSGEGPSGVAEAIRREGQLLANLRALADRVIATDELSPHQLRRDLQESLSRTDVRSTLLCQVVSFGFKYGIPRDADMVLDVRFLANPYFKSDLKGLDGQDERVIRFLENLPDYREFLGHVEGLLAFMMPRFVAEGKSYFTLAIGCTGGRHRSVALAERIAAWLRQTGYNVTTLHRDRTHEAEHS